MEVFRLSHAQFSMDLSGQGAKLYGGRWNSIGTPMLYTSSQISLCALELACNSGGLLGLNNLALTCISISTKASIEKLEIKDLPKNWQTYPSPIANKIVGDQFIKQQKAIAFAVPSVLVPEAMNYLINPLHPSFDKWVQILWNKPFTFDPRIL